VSVLCEARYLKDLPQRGNIAFGTRACRVAFAGADRFRRNVDRPAVAQIETPENRPLNHGAIDVPDDGK